MSDIYFYDHDKPYHEFSNFWPSPFSLDGLEWPTVEHYFQAHKTLDPAGREQVRRARTPRLARDLGRQVELRPDWDSVRDGVMLAALWAKFGQNPALAQVLLGTGSDRLHEASPSDRYWGVRGKDRLGWLLEQVRWELRSGMPRPAGNRAMLEHLFETGRIKLQRGRLFDQPPNPLPPGFDFERVEGMLLGLAIGDALGVTTEARLPAERQAEYGEIRDYLPHKHFGQPLGYPSDDSQMAFWTLEQLLADGGLDPDYLAARFCRDTIFGIGGTVKEFIRTYKDQGRPWYASGPTENAAGNGALMRIAPVLVPHLPSGTVELWADTALAAMITHNDPASTASCLAYVYILWQVLQMSTPPTPEWWLETFVRVARELEGDETRYQPRNSGVAPYRGPLWRFVQERVGQAYQARLPVIDAGNSWLSGAYLLETVPSVIYILMSHAEDPEEAIIRAVNDTRDNDTVAAIVGAAVGALHGKAALPARWLANLTGRTTERDDGRMFDLLAQTSQTWGR